MPNQKMPTGLTLNQVVDTVAADIPYSAARRPATVWRMAEIWSFVPSGVKVQAGRDAPTKPRSRRTPVPAA